MSLTKDQILQSDDLPREEVQVPEWGGSVFVRTMTGIERDSFEQSIVDTNGKSKGTNLKNIRAKLCAYTVVDDNGERLFTNEEAGQLGTKSSKALDRIFPVSQKLNGMSNEDVEELAKN